MHRRAFVVGGVATLPVLALTAEAQQTGKLWKIGFLGPSPSGTAPHLAQAFREGLRELGYVEGKNVVINYRSTEPGDYERYRVLAAELVRLRVDVIVSSITPAALAAKDATKTTPIVVVNVDDPVASGLVASLSYPGGNVTGLSRMSPELVSKSLALLKEAVPGAARIAMLSNPDNPFHPGMTKNGAEAASSLGVRLIIVEVKSPDTFGHAFGSMVGERVNALLVLSDGMFFFNRDRIADLALRNHLPSMFGTTELGKTGWLMAYGASSVDNYRRAATYVDKILKGANPGVLPIEQPTKFEFVINLKTARALGLTIPPSLLLRATQVIEQ